MNYPAWDVPYIGGTWVIATIAIIHVLISHFAVGGGLFLPIAERKALREGRDDWIPLLKKHSRFFLVLTAAGGTVTGVGIWFAIGLANPEGTSALIHNFVFGWAIEWVFFLVEIAAAAVYYYTWGRVSNRVHLQVGWLYAVTSLLTLVIINGILTFMLTPGPGWLEVAGTGQEASRFWQAFFNPTYWPSLLIRTLVCITLAGAYAFVTASLVKGADRAPLKESFARWSARWMIPGFVLLPAALGLYLAVLPPASRDLLLLGVDSAGAGAFTQVTRAVLFAIIGTATIFPIAFLLVWRDARDLKLGHAVAVLALALLVTGATEMAREMLRKPFVVREYMYSNGLRATEVVQGDALDKPYLETSPWVRQEEREAWATSSSRSQYHMTRGELMFRGQCMSCHTRDGYRSTRKLLANRDRNGVESILVMLHEQPEDSPYNRFMPPLMGTEEEIAALADYLYADSAEAREAYLEEEGLAEPETAPEEEPEETQQPDPLTTLTPDE